MKIKTSELSGVQLDYAVAKAEGYFSANGQIPEYWESPAGAEHFIKMRNAWHPVSWTLISTDWSEAGPIIEREHIHLKPTHNNTQWRSHTYDGKGNGVQNTMFGLTPLIAAMRCYVASKLGNEVEIPEELI